MKHQNITKVKEINRKILLELKELRPGTYFKCRIKCPDIDKWASGEDYPTYNQLVELSKLSDIPFGYFFLDEFTHKLLQENKQHRVIYISGSISKDPNYLSKFNNWEVILRSKYPNSEIKNPTKLVKIENGTEKEIWADAMIQCLNILKDCTDIFVIPENIESIGSDIEIMFADYLGLNFIWYYDL